MANFSVAASALHLLRKPPLDTDRLTIAPRRISLANHTVFDKTNAVAGRRLGPAHIPYNRQRRDVP